MRRKKKSGAGKMIAAVVVVVILLCGIFAIMRNLASPASADTVSYTHLTLPTILRV